jgi:hypothetical protein
MPETGSGAGLDSERAWTEPLGPHELESKTDTESNEQRPTRRIRAGMLGLRAAP